MRLIIDSLMQNELFLTWSATSYLGALTSLMAFLTGIAGKFSGIAGKFSGIAGKFSGIAANSLGLRQILWDCGLPARIHFS
ncbi:hypothetical protein JEZ13_10695 [bacterium]|nr:hypothetical protein [bacterium]